MIDLRQNKDGSLELYLDWVTSGYLMTAIMLSRPQGSSEAKAPEHTIRVHVVGRNVRG